MSGSIDMASKVDVYLKTPSLLGDDLDTQLLGWETKLILPYSESYRMAAKTAAERMAKANAAQKTAQEEAQKMVEVGMALTFFVIDIFTGAALSKIAGTASRLKSKQPLDVFIASEKSAGKAAVKYLGQSDSFADTIIGDVATKSLSGLSGAGLLKLRTAMTTLQSAVADTSALKSLFDGTVSDPEAFKTKLMEHYKGKIYDLKVCYANGVRDNTALSDKERRAVVQLMVTAPICRPPVHRFPADAMVMFIEPILWIARCLEIQANAPGGFGHLGGGVPGLGNRIGLQINLMLKQTGGTIITNAGIGPSGGALSGVEWDGHIGPYHVAVLRNMAQTHASGISNILSNMGPG